MKFVMPILKKEIDVSYLLYDLKRRNYNWREWSKERIRNLCPGPHFDVMDFKALLTKDDIFVTTVDKSSNWMWGDHIRNEYQFDDLKKYDVCLDLGANVGAFALRAAKLCNTVIAVEPLWSDILKKNLDLNPSLAKNIKIWEVALGDGKPTEIEFGGRKKIIETMTLKDMIETAGGISFLKIDIEGWEHGIPLDHFKNINRIELEYHEHLGAALPPNQTLITYLQDNWICQVTYKNSYDKGCYFHCYPKEKNK